MKNLKSLFGFIFVLGLASGCSNDDDTSKLTLALRTNTQPTVVAKAASVNNLVIDKFLVNITEIEFDIDNELQPELPDSVDSDEIVGPFVIDLASTQAEKGLLLGATAIPAAAYEDIEFEFDVCRDSKYPELVGHSVYVSGSVNGKPFVITTNENWEVEIDFEDHSNFVFSGDPQKLFIDFNLYQVLNTLAQIDFAAASDKNQNGVIEINPSDLDGNANLCDIIIEAFENALDLDDND